MGGDVQARVLVVEDDANVAEAIGRNLRYVGYEVEVATDPNGVIERLHTGDSGWDVVLLDVGLPGISGIDVLRHFRESGSFASIIMLTGDVTANTATMCMRGGAFHYLTKPFLPIELASIVESAARHTTLRRLLIQGDGVAPESMLVGTSPAMRRLRTAVERLALQEVSVLIQGESGTGKEIVARALHENGPRRTGPFIALNCSAIPESLIDSELFGHAKGSFTGAMSDRAGVFVEADGGTLFLDEVGDMPMSAQARLLRVLQEEEVRPVGGNGVRKVDVRVIAATHVNLTTAVTQNEFREDLFYRLNVVVVDVPPLRERLADVPLLAAHFLRKHGGSCPPSLSPEALDVMISDSWPGNVRELENALMHAIAFHQDGVINVESLPRQVGSRAQGTIPLRIIEDQDEFLPLTEAKRRLNASFERSYLMKVLERAKGSISEAARLAGIDRTNLRRLLRRYEIQPGSYRRGVRPR